jgi:hypothetical protein
MEINVEKTRAGRKHSSNSKIHVSVNANAVINILKQKGKFKILKKPFIYCSGILVCLLVFTFMAVSCDKLRNSIEGEYQQLTFAEFLQSLSASADSSVWKCEPNSNVSIILTFKPQESKMYEKTIPQTISRYYRFRDGRVDEYKMHGDSMYILRSNGNYSESPEFLINMFSNDTMEMRFIALDAGTNMNDFLFIRQPLN